MYPLSSESPRSFRLPDYFRPLKRLSFFLVRVSDAMDEDYSRKSIGALGDVHPVLSRPVVRLKVWFKGQEATDGSEVSANQIVQAPHYEVIPSHQLLKRVFSMVLVDLDSEHPQRFQVALYEQPSM
ncbi:hypothetical protein DUNSADRAFT_10811 [Dunaliella salina]|uniref:Uncharacterized protein n=1 Tax=Dunaliella salina TaxID=3046 RepID=A0ABQ7H9V1_DUNSA|nr:hypothetical protein DUNSADRAFT_10811 [Dunaliella salina]KAF5843638.1 hypothetical protein DUNSADRAFT_10811 [Dunaliella salina]|eukprot:KAF5843631.1 hypothetical protein DUNSADRAFT_10811 [Dunaliella salina]